MINKDLTIMELLQNYPETADKLKAMGMGCSICMGAATETIEQGVKAHGLNLEKVLSELNECIK